MQIKLLVGLGNPGSDYIVTRHNIGFKFINQVIKCSSMDVTKKVKHKSQLFKVMLKEQPLLCIKPQTYMNLSGEAVQQVAHFYDIKPAQICVITDDLDLDFGVARLRQKGGAGTHNGLKSVIHHLGTEGFLRLRLGIGPKPSVMDAKDFVLARFSETEQAQLSHLLPAVCEQFLSFFQGPVDQLMSAVNRSYISD